MSQVNPLLDGWVGYGDNGASILLETGTPIDADHPVVQARPELFTSPPAAEPRAEELPPAELPPAEELPTAEDPTVEPPAQPSRRGGRPRASNG